MGGLPGILLRKCVTRAARVAVDECDRCIIKGVCRLDVDGMTGTRPDDLECGHGVFYKGAVELKAPLVFATDQKRRNPIFSHPLPHWRCRRGIAQRLRNTTRVMQLGIRQQRRLHRRWESACVYRVHPHLHESSVAVAFDGFRLLQRAHPSGRDPCGYVPNAMDMNQIDGIELSL